MEILITLYNIRYTEYVNTVEGLDFRNLVFSLQKIQKCVDYLTWILFENKYHFYYGGKINKLYYNS